jgi:hypothetical protein
LDAGPTSLKGLSVRSWDRGRSAGRSHLISAAHPVIGNALEMKFGELT